ncbi:MAG: ROK family protein, partial [Candidatus Eremiobacteraeota bacterium]|nr:ROK family protein [Candidatus Eremiobacteraeota bacterium]
MHIGIDLGGTKIEIAAFASDEATLVRRRIATPASDYEAIVDAVGTLVEGVERELGTSGTVGIGTPGSTSPATGKIRNANSTVMIGKPFRHDVERRLGREIRIANDADCLALSEAGDGAAAGAATVFGVIIGSGVGGGIVVDGRLLPGRNGIAGEWGHNPMPWMTPEEFPGPPCYCGKRGCVETFL